ncbi:uncharacterized protein TNCV_762121 [Trichonephila clavipes]|nr:uncharacterized protein TNCV_762121 [Trichonephila clavipes]
MNTGPPQKKLRQWSTYIEVATEIGLCKLCSAEHHLCASEGATVSAYISASQGCSKLIVGIASMARSFKVDSVKSTPRIYGGWTSDRANCKGQLALPGRSERRLRRIERSQRSQTLAHTATQLNDGASRKVRKRTVQCSLTRMGFGSRRPTRVPLPNATIRLHVLPGQKSSETGV